MDGPVPPGLGEGPARPSGCDGPGFAERQTPRRYRGTPWPSHRRFAARACSANGAFNLIRAGRTHRSEPFGCRPKRSGRLARLPVADRGGDCLAVPPLTIDVGSSAPPLSPRRHRCYNSSLANPKYRSPALPSVDAGCRTLRGGRSTTDSMRRPLLAAQGPKRSMTMTPEQSEKQSDGPAKPGANERPTPMDPPFHHTLRKRSGKPRQGWAKKPVGEGASAQGPGLIMRAGARDGAEPAVNPDDAASSVGDARVPPPHASLDRRLTRQGLYVRGIHYTSPALTVARAAGCTRVSVRLDPADLGAVWALLDGAWDRVPCSFSTGEWASPGAHGRSPSRPRAGACAGWLQVDASAGPVTVAAGCAGAARLPTAPPKPCEITSDETGLG